MRYLQEQLAAIFGGRRKKSPPKSQLWAVWPDGRSNTITKEGRYWMWRHDSGSYPLAAAIAEVEYEGGKVVRLPIGERP